MDIMENYLEYHELFDRYTADELKLAWEAIHCSRIQEELYEDESPLLAFLIDIDLQEKLNLYFEDLEKDKLKGSIYDW
jgi:hypothetical protein